MIPYHFFFFVTSLSLFLFDPCIDGLIHLLNKTESSGDIEGIHFSEDGHSITHIISFYDSEPLVRFEDIHCEVIRLVLKTYGELWSND